MDEYESYSNDVIIKLVKKKKNQGADWFTQSLLWQQLLGNDTMIPCNHLLRTPETTAFISISLTSSMLLCDFLLGDSSTRALVLSRSHIGLWVRLNQLIRWYLTPQFDQTLQRVVAASAVNATASGRVSSGFHSITRHTHKMTAPYSHQLVVFGSSSSETAVAGKAIIFYVPTNQEFNSSYNWCYFFFLFPAAFIDVSRQLHHKHIQTYRDVISTMEESQINSSK